MSSRDAGVQNAARPSLLAFRASDHTAGNARSRIAGRLGFEVIGFRVDNDGTAKDRTVVVCQRHVVIEIIQFCRTRSVRLDIAHIANVPGGRIGGRVRLVRWIEMSAGRTCIDRAAIAEFMDMKAMHARSKAGEFCVDLHSVGDFSKRDGAAYFAALSGMHCGDSF